MDYLPGAFICAGVFFFIFAGAMLAGIFVQLGKIVKHLEGKTRGD